MIPLSPPVMIATFPSSRPLPLYFGSYCGFGCICVHGPVDGPSRYAYVNDDPLQQVDPTGLQEGLRIGFGLTRSGDEKSAIYNFGPTCVMVYFPSNVIVPKYISIDRGAIEQGNRTNSRWSPR